MIENTPTPLLRYWTRQLRALAPTVCDPGLQAELSSLAEAYEAAANRRPASEEIECLPAAQQADRQGTAQPRWDGHFGPVSRDL